MKVTAEWSRNQASEPNKMNRPGAAMRRGFSMEKPMPALKKTTFEGEIIWLGRVADRARGLPAAPVAQMALSFEGPLGEAHGGLTRPSCSRVLGLYPRGTPIRNTRQLSILSAEELDAIAADMGLPALDPALLGASMVVQGLPDFSHLPPSARLLAIWGRLPDRGHGKPPLHLARPPDRGAHTRVWRRFKGAAQGRRGITAWVEAEGVLALGDKLRLFIPDQPAWSPGKKTANRGQR
jgi:hypothetical protein